MSKTQHICENCGIMNDKQIALRFGKILREHRRAKGLTQAVLAEKCGLSTEHIQRLEGKRPSGVRLETIACLARALKLSIRRFLKDL